MVAFLFGAIFVVWIAKRALKRWWRPDASWTAAIIISVVIPYGLFMAYSVIRSQF